MTQPRHPRHRRRRHRKGNPRPPCSPRMTLHPPPNARYPVRARHPPSPIYNDLAQGNEMAQSQNLGAFTNVCAHSFAKLGGCMFFAKIRPTAVAMQTRHKALKTLMRDITNTDTVLNHIRTGHVALVTTHDDDLLSERQYLGTGGPHAGHDPIRVQGGDAQVRRGG